MVRGFVVRVVRGFVRESGSWGGCGGSDLIRGGLRWVRWWWFTVGMVVVVYGGFGGGGLQWACWWFKFLFFFF